MVYVKKYAHYDKVFEKGKKLMRAIAYEAARRAAKRSANTIVNGILEGGTGSVSRVYGTPQRYQQLRRKSFMEIDTPGGSTAAIKRRGAAYSKSAGKFKRLKRRSRQPRVRKAKEIDYVKYGVDRTFEGFKNEATTSQSLFFGHGTFVKSAFLLQAWQAVIKRVVAKDNVYITDWLASAEPYNTTAWRFGVVYAVNQVEAFASLTMAPGTTWLSIAQWCADVARPWYAIGSSIYLQRINIEPITAPDGRPILDVPINRCRIQYEIKSTLKMQNRTINSVVAGGPPNNEADDVDNVPIYGKSYEVNGTGLYRPKHEPTQIVEISGVNGYGVTNTVSYPEPISDLYYDKCKTHGKLKLDPGEIKTSVLNHKGTMLLNTLCRIVSENTGTTQGNYSVGKSRWFHLEKMIDTIATADLQFGITLGIEHNHRTRIVAKIVNNIVQAPLFERFAL